MAGCMTHRSNPERTAAIADAYLAAIRRGHERKDVIGWVANSFGVGRQAIYKQLRHGGTLPPYKSGWRARGTVPPVRQEPMRVDRDPCPRCGVRADIGCRHGSSGPLSGMLFA